MSSQVTKGVNGQSPLPGPVMTARDGEPRASSRIFLLHSEVSMHLGGVNPAPNVKNDVCRLTRSELKRVVSEMTPPPHPLRSLEAFWCVFLQERRQLLDG